MMIFALFILLFGCLISALGIVSLERKDISELLTYIGSVLVLSSSITIVLNLIL